MLKLMEKAVCLVLCVCTLFGVFLLIPSNANAAAKKSDIAFIWGLPNETYYCVTKNKAPLRTNPSDSGDIITRLDKGDFVKVTGTVRTWKTTVWLEVFYFYNNKARTGYLYSGNAKKHSVDINGMRAYADNLFCDYNIYDNWGITRVQAMELANNASSKTGVKNNLLAELRTRLEKSVGKSMDVSSYKTKTYYTYTDSNGIVRKNWDRYDKSGGCTWYAFNRFLEVNGEELQFKGAGGGNAKNWDERINTSFFSKISTKDLSNKTINAIAVDNQGSSGYGHVAYIELVLDGYVYYSHGWYKNGKFTSRLEKTSLKNFAKTFEAVLLPNSICKMP